MNPISEIIQGTSIYKDWIGEGQVPVSQELAEKRANTCLHCPQNKGGEWWLLNIWDDIKNAIGKAVRRQLSLKQKLSLNVSCEKELQTCRVCGCNLRLAVWVPIKHMATHTTQEQLSEFEPFCWKKLEIEEQKEPA